MALTELTDKIFEILTPVEIDKACDDIRKMLRDNMAWVSHPFHIAQRFVQKKDSARFIYPQTYIKDGSGNYNYLTLTPDNNYKGMFFFMVGAEKVDFVPAEYNNVTWPVSIIFSTNLELIDPDRLKNDGLFTQELIRDVRRALTMGLLGYDFEYTYVSATRDLREVYREFSLGDLEQYNRAPLQCFRIELLLTLQEEC